MITSRILYLSYDGILDPLGRSQILPYIKRLADKGAGYVLITFEKERALSDNKYVRMLNSELSNMGIKWIILKYHSRPAFFAKILDIIILAFVSLKAINENNILIVHARSYVASIAAIFAKKIYKNKFIFDMRGFWADERVEAGIWRCGGLRYRAAKCLEKQFLKNADEIVSLTHSGAAELKNLEYVKLSNNITVIPTCVDLEKFLYGQDVYSPRDVQIQESFQEFTLVYSGSLSTWCMPYEILFFFEAIKKNMQKARLLVLSQEKGLFELMLKKINLKDDSISVLNIDYEAMPVYLSACRAGLAFYKPGRSEKARCPTKIGEYLACGLPVIINKGVGDTEEIIKKERVGLIVNEFSKSEYERISNELKIILSEKDELSRRCRLTAEKYFSLKQGVEKYWQVYQRLLFI